MLRKLMYRNFRLVFRLSRWIERRVTPAGGVVVGGMVGAGVFGIDTRQTLAFQVAALCLALLAVAALAALPLRSQLAARRQLPRFTTAGVPLSYPVYVKNLGPQAEHDLHLLDQLNLELPSFEEFARTAETQETRNWFDRTVGYPRWVAAVRYKRGSRVAKTVVPPIPPGEEVEAQVDIRPLRRGYLAFSETLVLRTDPLGLINKYFGLRNPERLLVLPKRYPAPEIRFSGRRKFQPGGEGLASSVGDSQEFASLRDYRPGDPLQHIHWRSWAKSGKPVVKEYQDEFFDRQAIVLDTLCPLRSTARFEEAVSIAASFACADWGPDTLLDLLFVGPGAERFTVGRGLADTSNMLEVLACVQPSPSQAFSGLADLVLARTGQIGTAVCVLLDWDEPHKELIKQLRAQQLNVLVLVVIDQSAAYPAADTMAADPGNFLVLETGNVAATLATLGSGAIDVAPAKTGTDG